ncbi:uncharacterized protein METZ01_LOCUS403313, partial [marine metagenome]
MKILIISYTYWPQIEPRSIRGRSIADYWVKNGHSVSVITASPQKKQTKINKNDVNIIYIPENFIGLLRRKLSKEKTTEILSNAHQNISKVNKAINFNILLKSFIKLSYELILKRIQWPDFAWTWIFNARRGTLNHLNSNEAYDIIISVSHPFSSHLVAKSIKHKFQKMKWILDMGDPFCFLVESPPNNFLFYNALNRHIEGTCF